MKKIFMLISLCFTAMVGTVEAKVIPLVVESTFTNDIWFPLPVEQMKAAAVDTALTKISSTKKFAFLYRTKDKNIKYGLLSLAVTLIEPAEAAKLTIELSLPENSGTYVSSSSISLRNKNHKQIFEALEQLGTAAAEQLNLSASEIESVNTSNNQSDKIFNEIISLNINVIELHKNIGNNGAASHNRAIHARLGKLDTIINKLDKHHDYVKKNDKLQSRKLDSIYTELLKLNIGSNTGNSPPDGRKLTSFDLKLLPIINTAIKLKYKKDFSGAEKILSRVVKAKGISELFKSAIEEELLINLPIYEADIKKTELSYAFMDQVKGDKYKTTINRITSLYESVLKRPDVLFKKRIEIKQKLDSLMLTAESMNTIVKVMRKNDLNNLKMKIQAYMQRRMFSGYGRQDGLCPSNDQITTVIRKAKMQVFEFGSLKESSQWCDISLTDGNNNIENIKFNYEEVIITQKNSQSVASLSASDIAYELQVKKTELENRLRNKVVMFSNAIYFYYKKNKVLPLSITDLTCIEYNENVSEVACAAAKKDGVFYINDENNWVSVESYISNGEILKKCKSTIPLEMFDKRYGECTSLDINSIPKS